MPTRKKSRGKPMLCFTVYYMLDQIQKPVDVDNPRSIEFSGGVAVMI